MFSFQTQHMARAHREELLREATLMRVSESTHSHLPGKQSSHHMRTVVRRACLLAFGLGVIAGGILTTHFGLLPIVLFGSLMALVISPPILIQSARTLKAHLYTFQYGRIGHRWRDSHQSR
jgi:hypothetical protein